MNRLEKNLRRDAMAIYQSALSAADAGNAVRRHLSLRGRKLKVADVELSLADVDRVHLIAVGKAAGPMGLAVEEILGDRLTGGMIVTKHHHSVEGVRKCSQRTSSHPVPDRDGLSAAREVEDLLRQLNRRDLLLVAVSGGASALLPAPVPGVSLAAKQKTTGLLLRAGADIRQLNTVRKHLSLLKGGGMAALAYPATVVGLLLSDVIGDPLDVIGSGLTAPDESTYADALQVLDRFRLRSKVPPVVRRHFETGAEGKIPETPKSGDVAFDRVSNFVVASNRNSLAEAASKAKALGYHVAILSSTISGEAREAAAVLCEILRETSKSGSPISRPACLLAGGETIVTVKGKGRGGRNQEFALSAARVLAGEPGMLLLSIGTDGTDGPTDAAGAYATGSTIARGLRLNLDADATLAANDAYTYFRKLGDLIKTGPTGTNVMDICVMLSAAK